MSTTAPSEQEVHERFQELCADLNMDGNATDEAWQSYLRISTTYTLEVNIVIFLIGVVKNKCLLCLIYFLFIFI